MGVFLRKHGNGGRGERACALGAALALGVAELALDLGEHRAVALVQEAKAVVPTDCSEVGVEVASCVVLARAAAGRAL